MREELLPEARALREFYEKELLHEFPYKQLFALVERNGDSYRGVVQDLAGFHTKVARHCSAGASMLSWDSDQRWDAMKDCEHAFFDAFPKYRPLKRQVADYPRLADEIDRHEAARKRVVELVKKLGGK